MSLHAVKAFRLQRSAITGNGEAGQILFWGYAATTTGSTFDHNLIYGVSTIILDPTGFTIGTNQIGANPSFVIAAAAPYDFHEQSGGAGIDAGMNLAPVPVDFDGNPRPQGASTDLGATEYPTATNAPVISGVFTSGVTSNSASIDWNTDVASTSYVEYGPNGYGATTPVDTNLVTQHSVTLSGLIPSTLYHFRVDSVSNGSLGVSTDYTFTTSANLSVTSFSLSAASPSASVAQGQSTADTVTATLLTGSAAVSFAASSLPGA